MLRFIEGSINGRKYSTILSKQLIPSIKTLHSHEEFTFRQNCSSCHTAELTKAWCGPMKISICIYGIMHISEKKGPVVESLKRVIALVQNHTNKIKPIELITHKLTEK